MMKQREINRKRDLKQNQIDKSVYEDLKKELQKQKQLTETAETEKRDVQKKIVNQTQTIEDLRIQMHGYNKLKEEIENQVDTNEGKELVLVNNSCFYYFRDLPIQDAAGNCQPRNPDDEVKIQEDDLQRARADRKNWRVIIGHQAIWEAGQRGQDHKSPRGEEDPVDEDPKSDPGLIQDDGDPVQKEDKWP